MRTVEEAIAGTAHAAEHVLQQPWRNLLLRRLSAEAVAALAPHMRRAPLERGTLITSPGEAIETICFPEFGVASMLAVSGDGRIETAMIGREGMVGCPAVLGVMKAPDETRVVLPGTAVQVETAALLSFARRDRRTQELLLRFVQANAVQSAYSALSHGTATVHRRVARWLLMCDDRIDDGNLSITHDHLSSALAVRRSSVTDAIHVLEGELLIKAARGRIVIHDRQGLERYAGEFYGPAEAEYRRLFPPA